MMPIVDPHVALSRDGFSLDDYLTRSDSVHVLRMVAVQHPLSMHSALVDLQYYRDMSTTRGFGGFPNGVIAYCNLAETGSLNKLLSNELASIVRGVHFSPSQHLQADDLAQTSSLVDCTQWVRHLELLDSRDMSLDLTLSIDQCEMVDTIVSCNADITIVVTMQNWAQWLDSSKASLLTERFERLATYSNVNIKLCDIACTKDRRYASMQKHMINKCADYFGFDRIMFASCQGSENESLSINEQWASYVNIADTFTAIQRDKLFRSNAIRLYRL